MSIPAGFLVERFGEKPVMIAAFLAGTAGSLSFAVHPSYRVAVISLFVMGSGMATLQTAINPLLRVAGGEEHFAFNSEFAQLIFGIASLMSPYIYSSLVLTLGRATDQNLVLKVLGKLTPPALPWASMYWIFFFFQAEDGIRDTSVTGVQTCALPISRRSQCPLVAWTSAGCGPSSRRSNSHPGEDALNLYS